MSRNRKVNATQSFRPPAPLMGFGALLLLSLSLRCSGKSSDDGSSSGHSGTSTSAGQGGSGAQGGSNNGGQHAGNGGTPSTSGAGGFSIGGGPACSAATVADNCPLPASTCASDGRTLNYAYATCPAGICVYTTQSYECMGLCSNGACLASTTTTSGSPPSQSCTPTNQGGGGEGGDVAYNAGDCPIPPSTCADATTLDYYVVQCISGQCVTSLQSHRCAVSCVDGACQGNFTAK